MSDHPATWSDERLLAQCRLTRGRRRGPGGQHRNKVETCAVFVHEPTSITASAGERRSFEQNRREALFRLRLNLALQLRCPLDEDAIVPSELWRKRSRRGRVNVSATHPDFPCLLAEALDVLAACRWDAARAAERLGCSTTQFVRLLRQDGRALSLLNQHRRAAGKTPLR